MTMPFDESGAVMVEYALVLALLSLSVMAGMSVIEVTTSHALANVQIELTHYGLRDNT